MVLKVDRYAWVVWNLSYGSMNTCTHVYWHTCCYSFVSGVLIRVYEPHVSMVIVFAFVCIIYIYIFIYTYMYIYIYIHTHTYMYTYISYVIYIYMYIHRERESHYGDFAVIKLKWNACPEVVHAHASGSAQRPKKQKETPRRRTSIRAQRNAETGHCCVSGGASYREKEIDVCIYIYIYTYIHSMYIYIYIYIYCVYIYIYNTHTHIYMVTFRRIRGEVLLCEGAYRV